MKKVIDYIILAFFILGFLSALIVISEGGGKEKITKKTKDRIAVVKITGEIYPGYSDFIPAGAEKWSKSIRKFALDESVKAIILKINSPGGSVGSVQEVVEAVKYAKSKGKKIVSCFMDVAASGAYYIAAYSDKIVALPGSITGSIGVVLTAPNIEGLMKKIGVSVRVIKSGSMKDTGNIFREMTQEEIKYLEDLVNDAYKQFVGAVKEGRKMTDEEVNSVSDGRVFTGNIAKNKKLVDVLGSFYDAIEVAKELAGTPDAVVIYEKATPYEALLQQFFEQKAKTLSTIKLEYMMW